MTIQELGIIDITKGPDTWTLAESLFHDDEMLEDPIYLRFTGNAMNGEEVRISLSVDSVTRKREPKRTFHIKGIAKIYRRREWDFSDIPMEISYSTFNRRGAAQIKVTEGERKATLEAIEVLRKEAGLLDNWANEVASGGWSTIHLQPMRNRADQLRSKADTLDMAASK